MYSNHVPSPFLTQLLCVRSLHPRMQWAKKLISCQKIINKTRTTGLPSWRMQECWKIDFVIWRSFKRSSYSFNLVYVYFSPEGAWTLPPAQVLEASRPQRSPFPTEPRSLAPLCRIGNKRIFFRMQFSSPPLFSQFFFLLMKRWKWMLSVVLES